MAGVPVVAYDGDISGLPMSPRKPSQRIDPNDARVVKSVDHLSRTHDTTVQTVGGKKVYSYTFAFNGFAAQLTPEQVGQMARQPGVRVALVGVNRDKRQVILTAEAGGVSVRQVITNPTQHEALNLMTLTLPGFSAGTNTVALTLESPAVSSAHPFGGAGAAIIGASANYQCAMDN
jgi:hypothetical protein